LKQRSGFAILVLIALVCAPLLHRGAAAQSDGEPAYTSPTYSYTVDWNENDWTVTEESSQNDADLLTLQDGAATVTIQSWKGYAGNAPGCLTDIVAYSLTQGGIANPTLYPGFGSIGGTAWKAYATYQVDFTQQNGQIAQLVWSFECRTLVDPEAVLVLTWSAFANEYETERDAVNKLFATIDAGVDIDVSIVDGDGNPMPGLCVRSTANLNEQSCDEYDGTEDGRIAFPGLTAGNIGLTILETPAGYDPHWAVYTSFNPGENGEVTFRYVTGEGHPYAVPEGLCLDPDDPPWTAEMIDDAGDPILNIFLLDIDLNADDSATVEQAPPAMRNVTVTLRFKNVGQETLTIDPEDFLFYDENYLLTRAGADAAELLTSGEALKVTHLRPGAEVEGTLIFRVASDSPRPLNLLYSPDPGRMAPVISFQWMNGHDNCALRETDVDGGAASPVPGA
jgi:hypothetical protein